MEKKVIYDPNPSFPREIRRSLGESEVLLSFVNDADAEYFEVWWRDQGSESYAIYLDKARNEDPYAY